jgi:hypothetical protein
MRTPRATGQAAIDPCGLSGQSPPAVDVKRDAMDSGRGRAFSDNCRQRAYAASYKLVLFARGSFLLQ